jgi:hypothetical protein
MKQANWLLGILFVVAVALTLSGCATMQANPIDPKAPVISLTGFAPPPIGQRNGAAILKFGQRYGLGANVVKQDAPIIRVYRRLNYLVNNRGPWTTNFSPIKLIPSRWATVWTPWYWGPENTQKDNNDWALELEMWVVDADGRESNHLTAPAVIQFPN